MKLRDRLDKIQHWCMTWGCGIAIVLSLPSACAPYEDTPSDKYQHAFITCMSWANDNEQSADKTVESCTQYAKQYLSLEEGHDSYVPSN